MRSFILILLLCSFATMPLVARAQTPEFGSGQSAQPFFNIYNSLFGMFSTLKIPPPGPLAPEASPTTETTLPKVGGGPSTPEPDTVVANLRDLFQEVQTKVGVPAKILEGVLLIETPSLFYGLTDEQVQNDIIPGNVIPGCGPNYCSAAGPMQMTIGVDDTGNPTCYACGLENCPNAWASYGASVNTNGGYSHTPQPCNLRDNVYAAAAKLKADSGATSIGWSRDQVFQAAKRYYGSCSDSYRYARLDGKTYCEFLWDFYQSAVSASQK